MHISSDAIATNLFRIGDLVRNEESLPSSPPSSRSIWRRCSPESQAAAHSRQRMVLSGLSRRIQEFDEVGFFIGDIQSPHSDI